MFDLRVKKCKERSEEGSRLGEPATSSTRKREGRRNSEIREDIEWKGLKHRGCVKQAATSSSLQGADANIGLKVT